MKRLSALLARLQATHAWRSWSRYGDARGNVLAGGITYLGFFSLVPALVLGFTVFGIVLRSQPALFDRVVEYVSSTLPGIVKDSAHPDGLVDASNPPTPNALTISGAISLVTLLLGGLGWLGALREGVRAVFGTPPLKLSFLLGKLHDLLVLATLGLAILVSGLLSTVVNAAGPALLELVHLDRTSGLGTVALSAATVAVVFVVDLLIMLVVLWLLSGVPLQRPELLQGAVFGAVGLGVLKLASGLLLKSAANKPLLAGFALIIGLFVLINLISRVILLAAAWAATTAEDRGRLGPVLKPGHADTLRSTVPARDDTLPTFGQRSADRTSVLAGAVMGLTAVLGVQTARRGLHAAADAVRRR